MDPSQMEGYLTYYYEYHFLYITGIEHVESKNIQGIALMKLVFHPDTDMSQAMAEDAGSLPVAQLVFSSETRTPGEMQDIALNRVRPIFATLRACPRRRPSVEASGRSSSASTQSGC